MGRERTFLLARAGGRRRTLAEDPGGGEWGVAAFLGPLEAGVDLSVGGVAAAEVRGAGMPAGAYSASLAGGGERLLVTGRAPRLDVRSDRRAPTEVLVAAEAGGCRALTWSEDGAIAGVLRTFPARGAEPWHLGIAGHADPVRTAALLLAADRLLRENDRAGGA